MAIEWQQLPARSDQLPYNGDRVILAVPHLIGVDFGGDGTMLDPDYPFSIHVARWDDERLEWATNETDDETGGILWVKQTAPFFWADPNLPTELPRAAFARACPSATTVSR